MVLLSNVIVFLISDLLLAFVGGRDSTQPRHISNEPPTIRKFNQWNTLVSNSNKSGLAYSTGTGGWERAQVKANAFIARLNLTEKANIHRW